MKAFYNIRILLMHYYWVWVCREEVEQLCLEKVQLQESLEKLQGHCQEMEEQCIQHGRMHQRMKHRYISLQGESLEHICQTPGSQRGAQREIFFIVSVMPCKHRNSETLFRNLSTLGCGFINRFFCFPLLNNKKNFCRCNESIRYFEGEEMELVVK